MSDPGTVYVPLEYSNGIMHIDVFLTNYTKLRGVERDGMKDTLLDAVCIKVYI